MPAPDDLQAQWLRAAVRHMIEHTEDVGERFADEARRIHYGEIAQRGVRGRATPATPRRCARASSSCRCRCRRR